MPDYGELFCEAVDTIVKERLNGISYDRTILCTIVDDSRRGEGLYIVSENNQAKFEAYSDKTSYRNGNNVYVQIPGGDWNQQKLIVSKKTDKSIEPYNYQRPFSNLVDLTGNLITNSSEVWGLTANNPNIITINIPINYDATKMKGFTRLGIQAAFQTWLNTFYNSNNELRKVIAGEYGLRLIIKGTEALASDENSVEKEYELVFNQQDMNGNPYDFQSYFVQEKVFDISKLAKIDSLSLEFYQMPNTFADSDGEKIPYEDWLGNPIAPNLYVNDIYISLGYDVNDFEDEMLQIYSSSSDTYFRTLSTEQNAKQLQARWIRKVSEGVFESVDETTDLEYSLYWYRYELGKASADKYSGVYWQYLQDGDKSFSATLNPDISLQNEQIKAILIHDGNIYRSNILTFANEEEVVNRPTVEIATALSIQCSDDSFGNYLIYTQGNSLIDSSQGRVEREFIPYLRPRGASASEQLRDNAVVEWIIPASKTMIVLNDGDKVNLGEDNNYHIIKDEDNNLNLKYHIRSFYSQSYTNNIIQCKVTKDNITYTSSKELTFGPAGTSGTDVTFVLDFKENNSAMTIGSTDAVEVVAKLYDYENNEIDLTNYLNDKTNGITIEWGWKVTETDDIFASIPVQNTFEGELKLKSGVTMPSENYYILKATLRRWGDGVPLVAYLPIPIRSDAKYQYINGVTQVVYQSSGELFDYFKTPYRLFEKVNSDFKIVDKATWGLKASTPQGTNKLLPQIIEDRQGDYILQPLNFYIAGNNEQICVNAKLDDNIIWSQPILITQNLYPSNLVNDWNGELLVDNNKNAIFSARFVAGKKDSNNTFTGIMLGDWGESSSSDSEPSLNTGLFGYQLGEQSFGFKADGTAFIGKSGAGRLLFDGERSTIKSGGYESTDSNGLLLDFDDALIRLKHSNGNQILLDANASTYPLQIGSNNNYKFKVKWDGTLEATNADLSGKIEATSGTIGGWTIGEDGLSNGDTSFTSEGFVAKNWVLGSAGISYFNKDTGYIKQIINTDTGFNSSWIALSCDTLSVSLGMTMGDYLVEICNNLSNALGYPYAYILTGTVLNQIKAIQDQNQDNYITLVDVVGSLNILLDESGYPLIDM